MIVIDASAACELLLDSVKGRQVWDRIEHADSMHAPHLLDAEVLSALRKSVRLRTISAERGKAALADLREIVISRYPLDLLLDRMWELRDRASAYDAAYLSLAETLGAPLLTCDRRLASTVGHEATVELI